MAVTISDIAESAGCTKTTVSRVLNRKKSLIPISDSTRERIFGAAKKMNYRPSFMARSLVHGKTSIFGLVYGDYLQSPHYAEFASKALHEAELKGYHLLVSTTEWDTEKERECIDSMLDGRVDGLIITTTSPVLAPGTSQYRWIMENHFPIVTTEHSIKGITSVLTDYRPGMDQAVELLQSLGHERIGFIRFGEYRGERPFEQYAAFHDSCREHHITSCDYRCNFETNATMRLATDSIKLPMDNAIALGRQLAEKDAPQAFIVYCDYAAMAVIRGLREAGLDVPRDVDVIGIDDTQWNEYSVLALTSIYQDRRQIASKALDVLLEKIDKPDTPPKLITVPSRLVKRESTK